MARPRLLAGLLLLAAVAVLGLAGVRQLRLSKSQAPIGDTATSRGTMSDRCGLGVPPELAERCRAALSATDQRERQQIIVFAGLGSLLLLGAVALQLLSTRARKSSTRA